MKVLKLPRQLFHLNLLYKIYPEMCHKILPIYVLHNRRSYNMTNFLPPVVSSVPHKAGYEPHLRHLRAEVRSLSILNVCNPLVTGNGVLIP